MFKAHKHALSALYNRLHWIAGTIYAADRKAKKLKTHLERVQSVGKQVQSINEDVKSIWRWLAPAKAYNHALAQVKRLGLSPAEVQQAKNAAWRNTQAIPTSTAAENLRDFAVLRQRLGNSAAALRLLPIVECTKAPMAAAPEGGGRKIAARMAAAVNARANGGAQMAKESGGAFICCCDLPVLRQSAQNRNAVPRAVSAEACHACSKAWKLWSKAREIWSKGRKIWSTARKIWSTARKIWSTARKIWSTARKIWSTARELWSTARELWSKGRELWSKGRELWGKARTAIDVLKKLRGATVKGEVEGSGRWLANIEARLGPWWERIMGNGKRLIGSLYDTSGVAVRRLVNVARRMKPFLGSVVRWLRRLTPFLRTILRRGALLGGLVGIIAPLAGAAIAPLMAALAEVLLPALALAAVGYISWKATSIAIKYGLNPIIKRLTGGKAWDLSDWIFGEKHHEINPVAPVAQKTVQVHSTIHLDGRRVAETVTRHQAQSANRPAASGRSYDASMAAPPIQMSYPR